MTSKKSKLFKNKRFTKLFCAGLIGAVITSSSVGAIVATRNNDQTNNAVLSKSNNLNNNINNTTANLSSNLRSNIDNFLATNTINANQEAYNKMSNVVNQFLKNANINKNSTGFKSGFASEINKMTSSSSYLSSVLNSKNKLNSSNFQQLSVLLNQLKQQYGTTNTNEINLNATNNIVNTFSKLNVSNLFSIKYQVKSLLNTTVKDLSSLSDSLAQQQTYLEITGGVIAAVLTVLGFFDAGTTGIIAAVIGAVIEINVRVISALIGTLNNDVKQLQLTIDNTSDLLVYTTSLSQTAKTILTCINSLEAAQKKLAGYGWVIGVNKVINSFKISITNLSSMYYEVMNTINYVTLAAQSSNTITNNINNTVAYMQSAILNWLNSNENVLNSPNSSFTDLIQQNMSGYNIVNDAKDFSNFKVSFTQLSNQDASDLGSLANEKWLTISATANTTINFSTWNNYGYWNYYTSKSVPAGTLFTWVLPYSSNSITIQNNQLSMSVNSTYSNSYNNNQANLSLPVPFGLSIGSSSNPTSISSTWSGNFNGVIATNFGTYIDKYTLPTTWSVSLSNSAKFANAFNDAIINNASNFANTNESAATFMNNMMNEWMVGYKFNNLSINDFNNWHVQWSNETVNGYKLLQISAYSNTNIVPSYWDNQTNSGKLMQYMIPAKSYFVWTLPYYEQGVNSNNNLVSANAISYSDYFDGDAGLPTSTWKNNPLGLTIGSLNDPTAISNSYIFKTYYTNYTDTTYNGTIAIGYNENTPNLSFNTSSLTNNGQYSISTIDVKLNNLNMNNLLNLGNISSLSAYLNDYKQSWFESGLIDNLISNEALTITNMSYNASNISNITVRNNTNENVELVYQGQDILSLKPNQVQTVNVNISLINWQTFINDNTNLNLTTLWQENNPGAVNYYHTMGAYNESDAYDVAAVYGLLTTNINSLGQYNGYDFSNYGSNYAKTITSSTWNAYYNPRQCNQTIQLSWIAEMLGFSSNGFDGYQIYAQNGSNIVINKVDYNNVWYNVNYNINLGSRFSLYWNFFIFTW